MIVFPARLSARVACRGYGRCPRSVLEISPPSGPSRQAAARLRATHRSSPSARAAGAAVGSRPRPLPRARPGTSRSDRRRGRHRWRPPAAPRSHQRDRPGALAMPSPCPVPCHRRWRDRACRRAGLPGRRGSGRRSAPRSPRDGWGSPSSRPAGTATSRSRRKSRANSARASRSRSGCRHGRDARTRRCRPGLRAPAPARRHTAGCAPAARACRQDSARWHCRW